MPQPLENHARDPVPLWQHQAWEPLGSKVPSDGMRQTLLAEKLLLQQNHKLYLPSKSTGDKWDALHTDFKECDSQSKGQGVTAD